MQRWLALAFLLVVTVILVVVIVTRVIDRRPSLPVGERIELAAESQPAFAVTRIVENGARVDWSAELDLIAFDRLGEGNFYDVWVMEPDGSNERCVTCETRGLPRRNVGQPAWHPSGEFIAVQAEKEDHPGGSRRARPGVGVENDIWIVTADGSRAVQVTSVPDGSGVLHPHFSHDGGQLLWAEIIELPDALVGGVWAMRLADVTIENGEPRVGEVETLQPRGPVFYETHGFSYDDTRIIYTSNPESGQVSGFDIYVTELSTGESVNLTDSPGVWDEHAHFSPSDEKIVWMSSMDCGCEFSDTRLGGLRTDLWLMDADGSNKTRLTRFDDEDFPARAGRKVIAGDSSWSPDGERLALFLIADRGLLTILNLTGRSGETIVRIDFSDPQ